MINPFLINNYIYNWRADENSNSIYINLRGILLKHGVVASGEKDTRQKFFKGTINNIAAGSVQWPFIFSVKPRAIIGLVSIEAGCLRYNGDKRGSITENREFHRAVKNQKIVRRLKPFKNVGCKKKKKKERKVLSEPLNSSPRCKWCK